MQYGNTNIPICDLKILEQKWNSIYGFRMKRLGLNIKVSSISSLLKVGAESLRSDSCRKEIRKSVRLVKSLG